MKGFIGEEVIKSQENIYYHDPRSRFFLNQTSVFKSESERTNSQAFQK